MAVNRFHTANLTDADARRILAAASEVLTTDDGADDVACATNFQLQGAVTTFTVGDGSVDSEAEYLAVRATGGRVHVVRDITWCSRPLPGVIGCSDTPGTCMVVRRHADAAVEAVLWAHEFGHNQGLGDNVIAGNVMNGTIRGTNRNVSQAQCNAFRVLSPGVEGREQRQTPSEVGESAMDIKEFVRSIHIHGVPYTRASAYPADVVPVLLEMLRDPAEEPYRVNIVATLGMIGDPRAVQPLLELFAEGGGQLSDEEFKVRKTVVISLGYLLNKTEDREALEFLAEGLNPESWTRKVGWESPEGLSEEHTQSQLTKMAVWGLALSGRPEAREALVSLQQAPLATFSEGTRGIFLDVVQEAAETYLTVAEQGLLGLYQKGHEEMGHSQQSEPARDFGERQEDGEIRRTVAAGLGDVIEAGEAEKLLSAVREAAVTIPLWKDGYRNVVSIRFESEQWMRVFAYLPENGNKGYIWVGNVNNPAAQAWHIGAGYSVVKLEIDYWDGGDWRPVYPTIHTHPMPSPDPTVRVCGNAPGGMGCDVNVFVFPVKA
jgi:hypothetical protein